MEVLTPEKQFLLPAEIVRSTSKAATNWIGQSFIRSLDFKGRWGQHDHWTSRLKVSNKDTQMF